MSLINTSGIALCIIISTVDAYSETFIHAHIKSMPFDSHVIYGSNLGNYRVVDDDRALAPWWVPRAIVKRPILSRAGQYFWSNFSKKGLERFLKKNKISVVLAESGLIGVNVMDTCQELKLPLIVHFHGKDAYDQQLLASSGKHYPELFNIASDVVGVSKSMIQQLIGLGAPLEKIHYNPYGVDLTLFYGADPSESPPTFIAVGRFVDKKAPHLTLLAWANVAKEIPNAKLLMIGDGALLESCRLLASALNVQHCVVFLGVLSHQDVASAMRNARAFVQHSVRPSYGDSEGTPVAILEAGAAGLPVIATRHAGITDVIIEGETGFLVDELDVNGMSDYMLKLAQNNVLAAQMGQAARKRIMERFSMEQSIEHLAQIIFRAYSHRG